MIVVRPGRREDLDAIVSMQVAMAAETEPFRLDPPTVHQGVAAVFDDPHKGTYWIAESGGSIAGMLLTIPEWSDWRNGTVLWIHSVYVDPAFRGQGVYKALYQHLRARVEADPALRGLRLYVEKSNARAQTVYAKLGMSDDHYKLFEWMKGF